MTPAALPYATHFFCTPAGSPFTAISLPFLPPHCLLGTFSGFLHRSHCSFYYLHWVNLHTHLCYHTYLHTTTYLCTRLFLPRTYYLFRSDFVLDSSAHTIFFAAVTHLHTCCTHSHTHTTTHIFACFIPMQDRISTPPSHATLPTTATAYSAYLPTIPTTFSYSHHTVLLYTTIYHLPPRSSAYVPRARSYTYILLHLMPAVLPSLWTYRLPPPPPRRSSQFLLYPTACYLHLPATHTFYLLRFGFPVPPALRSTLFTLTWFYLHTPFWFLGATHTHTTIPTPFLDHTLLRPTVTTTTFCTLLFLQFYTWVPRLPLHGPPTYLTMILTYYCTCYLHTVHTLPPPPPIPTCLFFLPTHNCTTLCWLRFRTRFLPYYMYYTHTHVAAGFQSHSLPILPATPTYHPTCQFLLMPTQSPFPCTTGSVWVPTCLPTIPVLLYHPITTYWSFVVTLLTPGPFSIPTFPTHLGLFNSSGQAPPYLRFYTTTLPPPPPPAHVGAFTFYLLLSTCTFPHLGGLPSDAFTPPPFYHVPSTTCTRYSAVPHRMFLHTHTFLPPHTGAAVPHMPPHTTTGLSTTTTTTYYSVLLLPLGLVLVLLCSPA